MLQSSFNLVHSVILKKHWYIRICHIWSQENIFLHYQQYQRSVCWIDHIFYWEYRIALLYYNCRMHTNYKIATFYGVYYLSRKLVLMILSITYFNVMKCWGILNKANSCKHIRHLNCQFLLSIGWVT